MPRLSLFCRDLITPTSLTANGRWYTRDGGRSSSINGVVLHQFGDTFAHDATENFVGLSSSNASLVKSPTRKPTLSTYSGIGAGSTIPVNPPPISGEESNENYRTTTWCFGGVVFEDPVQGEIVKGYTYFQNSHIVSYIPVLRV